jgi:hypothetical protein
MPNDTAAKKTSSSKDCDDAGNHRAPVVSLGSWPPVAGCQTIHNGGLQQLVGMHLGLAPRYSAIGSYRGSTIKGSGGLDTRVRELALLTMLACLGLGLAWAYEADYFAVVFCHRGNLRRVRGGSTISVTRFHPLAHGFVGPVDGCHTHALVTAHTQCGHRAPTLRAQKPATDAIKDLTYEQDLIIFCTLTS